jgi:primosomal protein N'
MDEPPVKDRNGAVVSTQQLKVGDRVKVPWGFEDLTGVVTEVWGDPPAHVRVALVVEEGEEPEVLLLNPSVVSKVS